MKSHAFVLLIFVLLTGCKFADFVNNLSTDPIVLFSPAPGNFVNSTNQSTFVISGSCGVEGAEIRFNHGSATTICENESYTSSLDLSGMPEGEITLISMMNDEDGNLLESNTVTLMKDTNVAPPTIDTPASGDTVYAVDQSLTGMCEDGGEVFITGDLGAVPSSASCTGGTYTINIQLTAGDSVKNLEAYQVDEASNTSSTVTHTLNLIETTLATISIGTPTNGDLVNSANQNAFAVMGTCDLAGEAVNFNIGVGSATCDGTNFSVNLDLSGEADGLLTLTANSVDQFSNPISSNTVTLSKDTLAPTIAIATPSNGDGVNTTNQNNFTVSGTCSEAGQTVTFSNGTGTATCDGTNFTTNLDMSGEADGTINLVASISDSAGNTSNSNTVTLSKDTLAPTIAIATPSNGDEVNTSNENNFTVSGTCSEAGQTVTFSNGTGTATCDGTNFTTNLDMSGETDGTINLVATISDSSGNTSNSNTVTLSKDTMVPTIAISTPTNGTYINIANENNFPVSGTCNEAGQAVTFSHGSGSITCDGTNFNGNLNMSAVPDSSFNLQASIDDGNGNTGLSNLVSLIKDTTAPAIAITTPAPGDVVNISNEGSFEVSGTCDEAGQPVMFSHGMGAAVCDGANFTVNLDMSGEADGTLPLEVSLTDPAGNTTTSTTVNVTKDTVSPNIAITTPVDGDFVNLSNQNLFLVEGTCDEAGQSVSFSHGAGTATCDGVNFTTNLDMTSVSDGPISLVASISDASGNTSDSAAVDIIKDTALPTVTITTPADGDYVNASNEGAFLVEGTCTEAGEDVTFSHGVGMATCDGANYTTNLNMTALPEGPVSLVATLSDVAGNTSNSPAVNIIKDSLGPSVAITTPVDGDTVNAGNEVAFLVEGTCDEATQTVTFSHGVGTATCDGTNFSTNLDLSGEGDGTIALEATLSDPAGNATTSVAVNITKDTQAPNITITTPIDGDYINSSNEGSFSVTGLCNEGGQTVTFSNGTGTGLCDGANYTANLDMSGVSEGAVTLQATLTDAGGNSAMSNTVNLVKDTVAPNIAITTPVDGDTVNSNNQLTFFVEGTCDEAGQNVMFSHGVGVSTCDGANFSVNLDMSGVGDGPIGLEVTLSDDAGNTGTSPTVNISKDTIAPAVAITTPNDGDVINLSNESSFLVEGTCDEAGQNVTFSNGVGAALCDGANFTTNLDMSAESEGAIALTASINDAANNTGDSLPVNIVKDTTPPTIAITTPNAGDYINTTNEAMFTVEGTCSEAGQTVTFSHGAGTTNCDGALFATDLDMSGVPDGPISLQAIVSDASGNTTTSSAINIVKDTVAPAIAITTPTDGDFITTSNEANYLVEGTCDENGQNVTFNIGVGTATCDGANFSTNLDMSAVAEGALTLQASVSDVAGNSTTSAAVNITKDTNAPLVAITTPTDGDYINIANEANFLVEGTCDEAGENVTFSHGVGVALCDGANFMANLDMSGVAEGAVGLIASLSDAAGNSSNSSTVNLTKDTVAPAIAITTPVDGDQVNASNEANFLVEGTCDEAGQTVTFSHGAGTANCDGTNFTTNLDMSGEGDGALPLQATLSDDAGNTTTSASVFITKDTLAPNVAITNPTDGDYINSANETNILITGTCNEAGRPVSFTHGTGSAVCDGTNFNASVDMSAVPDGSFNLQADISDSTGNTAVSNMVSLIKDTVAPTIAIATPVDGDYVNTSNETTFLVEGTCDEAGQTVTFSHGTGTANCDGANFTTNLDMSGEADGAIALVASVLDVAGNSAASVAVNIIKDTTPPTIAITSPVNGDYVNSLNEASYLVEGTCSEAGQTVTFTPNAGTANCDGSNFTANLDFSAVAEGAFNLQANLQDTSGNSSASNTVNLIKDTTAPSLTFVNPAEGTVYNAASANNITIDGTCNEVGTITVNLTGNPAGQTINGVNCDGANFTVNFDISVFTDGNLGIDGEITDLAGNVGFSTNALGLEIDRTAPTIAITTPVDGDYINASNEAAFLVEGTCDEAGQTVTFSHGVGTANCDGANFTANLDMSGEAEGAISLTSSVSDAAGNAATSAAVNIVKDTTAPTIAITTPTNGDYINTTNEAAFLVEGTCNENGQTVTFNTGVGTANCDGANFTTNLDMSGVADGAVVLEATLSDAGGNTATSAPVNLNKDTVAPNIAITTPTDGDSVNTGNEAAFLVEGTCDEAGQTVTFSHGTGTANCDGANFTTNLDMTGVGDGAIPLDASLSDAAGNTGTSTAVNLTKDTLAPAVAITTPTNGDYINTTNEAAFLVAGTCNEGGQTVTFNSGVGTANCDGANFTTNLDMSGVADGAVVLEATLSDAGGNTTTSAPVSLVKDTVAPSIAITTPTNGDYITPSNEALFTVEGTCDEAGRAVTFSHGVGTVNCDGANFTVDLDMTGVSEGPLSLQAAVSDVAGNATVSTGVNIEKDTTPPAIAFTTPTNGDLITPSNESFFLVEGTCEVQGAIISFNVGAGTATCTASNDFSDYLDFSGEPEGNVSLTASLTDAAGNVGTSLAVSLTKDTTAPTIAITTPTNGDYINVANESSFLVEGTCDEAGQAVTFSHGAGAVNCDGTNFSTNLDMSGESDGAIALTVSISDAVGNTSTSAAVNIIKDTLAPPITITTPPEGGFINASNETNFLVEGLCYEVGQTVTFTHGVGTANCDGNNYSTTLDMSGVADSTFALRAFISDAAGNVGSSAPVNLTKDTTAPTIAIITPVDGDYINTANEAAFLVDGTCNEAGQTVTFSHGAGTATCDGTNFSTNLDMSGESEGAITLTASVSDAAGNTSASAPVNIIKDTTAPTLAITTPTNGDYVNIANEANFLVEGTCGEASQQVTFSHGIGAVNCDGANFTTNLDMTGVSEGPFTLQAAISDGAGNSALSTGVNLIKDTVAPTVTVSSPTDGFTIDSTNVAMVPVTGTCTENGQPINFSSGTGTVTCASGSFNGTLDFSAQPDGTFDLAVTQTDVAGNTSTPVEVSLYKTSVPPSVPFEYTLRVTNAGLNYTLPIKDTYNYNFDVDWGDGSPTSKVTSFSDTDKSHTFSAAGDYTITLSGLVEGWGGSAPDQKCNPDQEILTVSEFGSVGWKDLRFAFIRCEQLTTFQGGDVSQVTSMEGMFRRATLVEPDTSGWDTTNVTYMGGMFYEASSANPDTSGWNTENVIDMSYMFNNATTAEPNTSGWDTTNVTNMRSMFTGASSANPDTSGWDTSSVTDMRFMFKDATAADPDTSGFDTANVTRMNSMFSGASAANPDTSGWDTSSVTDMSYMFRDATSAAPNTSNWNTGNVTDMAFMFYYAASANPDTSGWDTSNVNRMDGMFSNTTVANPDTSGWNTSSVFLMNSMFNDAAAANPDVSGWNTSSVTGMDRIFKNAASANPDLDGFDFTTANIFSSLEDMIGGSNISPANYSNFLINLDSQAINGAVTNRLINSPVCYLSSAASARASLVSSAAAKDWNINDAGPCPLPTIAVTSPVDASYINASNENSITVSGTCSENGNPITLSHGTGSLTCSSGSFSGSVDFSGESDGSIPLQLSIQDGFGQTGVSTVVNLTKDTVAPSIAITTPTNGDYITPSNEALFTVEGTCDEAGRTVTFSHGVGTVNCDGANFTVDLDMTGVSEGPLSLQAAVSDVAGNATVSTGVNIEKDTTPPAIAFTTPTNGDLITTSNESFFLVEGTCEVQGAIISFNVGAGTATCTASNDFSSYMDLSGEPEGNVSLTASLTDAAGNVGTSLAVSLTKDTTAPTIAITTPTDGDYINRSNENNFLVEGTCDEAGQAVTFSHGAGAVNCDGTNFSTNLDMSGESEGAIALTASVSDAAGNNATSAAVNIIKDTVNPVIGLTASSNTITQANESSFAVSGTCDAAGRTVTFSHGVGTATCNGSNYSTNLDMSGVSDGPIALTASISDVAGNSSTSFVESLTKNTGGTATFRYRITSSKRTLDLPTRPGFAYNFDVDWGDGTPVQTVTSASDPDASHTYASNGIYDVVLTGTAQAIFRACGFSDDFELLEVPNLGDMGWINLRDAFSNCSFLTNVSGGDTSEVNTMQNMFRSSPVVTPDTSGWDTANVTDMAFMFDDAKQANPDTSGWDTGNVTTMWGMFANTDSANPDVSNWDVSNVENMSYMFQVAQVAEPQTGSWVTTSLTDTRYMFAFTPLANPDTSGWDTSNVINMEGMFSDTAQADPDVSNWDVSNVEDMSSMFKVAQVAEPQTGSWVTTSLTDTSEMFAFSPSVNPDVRNWDVSNVTHMRTMFKLSATANPDTSLWDTSSVVFLEEMFQGTASANPDVSNWDVSNVTRMTDMFNGAQSANPDTSLWDFSSISGFGSSMSRFLEGAVGISNTNYSNFLVRFEATVSHTSPLSFGNVPAAYQPAAATARSNLQGLGYTINDEGPE